MEFFLYSYSEINNFIPTASMFMLYCAMKNRPFVNAVLWDSFENLFFTGELDMRGNNLEHFQVHYDVVARINCGRLPKIYQTASSLLDMDSPLAKRPQEFPNFDALKNAINIEEVIAYFPDHNNNPGFDILSIEKRKDGTNICVAIEARASLTDSTTSFGVNDLVDQIQKSLRSFKGRKFENVPVLFMFLLARNTTKKIKELSNSLQTLHIKNQKVTYSHYSDQHDQSSRYFLLICNRNYMESSYFLFENYLTSILDRVSTQK